MLQNSKPDDLAEITIVVDDEKEFTAYARLYERMVSEALREKNLIIDSDS